MTAPKDLSIITVVYKNPNGLKETLHSLKPLLNSKISWEHVIVDSSPDQHKAILDDSPDLWPRIYVTEPPTGIYPAMNLGWRMAQGKLLYFLNAGDRLKNLEALADGIKQFQDDSNLDLLLYSADLYRDGKFLYSKTPHPSFLRNILGANNICHQAVLYRRSAFERVGEFSTRYKLASDYEHYFRCFLAGLKHKVLNVHLVEYEMGGQSDRHEEVLTEYAAIHAALAPQLPSHIVKLNAFFLRLETMRLSIVKSAAASRFSETLRPVWLWWNRRRQI